MEERTIKLSFVAPVHFGRGRLSDSAYTCDAATLFSALYIEAAKSGTANGLLQATKAREFSLSNAFPYIGDTTYLPKPVTAPTFQENDGRIDDPRMRKAGKKIPFIPMQSYADFLDGNFDTIGALEEFSAGIGTPALQTKVNLTRENKEDADPYHVGSFTFGPTAGLYFIVRGSFDIDPLIDQLQYSGLGGKRTSGYGRFRYSISAEGGVGRFQTNSGHFERYILLSNAAPTEQELGNELLSDARYRLIRKSGFVQSEIHSQNPQKKRDLYVFAAGSIFTHKFSGEIYDVNATPDAHSVYRYARAMWMEV